jgi:hypothetical protein
MDCPYKSKISKQAVQIESNTMRGFLPPTPPHSAKLHVGYGIKKTRKVSNHGVADFPRMPKKLFARV